MNNNLFRHIEYLLLSNDCVIVPGLGAFIAISRPASIDHDNGIILPPSRSVIFNQAVMSDDGLLANSIARKHNLSFDEARQVILRETAIIKERLFFDKAVTAGRLGILTMGEESNLVFTPSDNIGNLNAAMGLMDVRFKAVAENHPSEESSDDTPYYQLRINKAIIQVAAVFALLIATAAFFLLNPIPSDDREQRASVVPVEAIIHTTLSHESPKTVADSAKTEESAEEAIEEIAPAEIAAQYYLIVATFSNEKEAEKFVASNSSDECPMNLVKSRRMTRVSIAESQSKDELRKRLNSHEVLSKYPNAWIWSRE